MPLTVGSMAEVLGDTARKAWNPKGVPWDRLTRSEQDRWRAVGEALIRRLSQLDGP